MGRVMGDGRARPEDTGPRRGEPSREATSGRWVRSARRGVVALVDLERRSLSG